MSPACSCQDTCWLTWVCQRNGAKMDPGERTAPRTCPAAQPSRPIVPRSSRPAFLVSAAGIVAAAASIAHTLGWLA